MLFMYVLIGTTLYVLEHSHKVVYVEVSLVLESSCTTGQWRSRVHLLKSRRVLLKGEDWCGVPLRRYN